MMEIQRILMALAVIFCFCASAADDISLQYITELDVVAGNADVKCKKGYTKLPQDLNNGTQSTTTSVFACIKRGDGFLKTPLNDITVIEDKRSVSAFDCPDNYDFVETDLNSDTKADDIHFCYSRGHDTMITEIDFIQSVKSIYYFNTTNPNKKCSTNNLNEGAGGFNIYMCYSFVENNITEIQLYDVVYDFDQVNDSFQFATVEDILISNPSDIDTAPAILTGTYSFTATSNWEVSDSESQTRENEVNVKLTVKAGIPCLGAAAEVGGDVGYKWKMSETQTHETTTGLGVTVQVDSSYSISCVAPKKTSTECGGEYKQGKISVPFNATKKTIYENGEYIFTNITNCIYSGTSFAVLEIFQEIFELP